MSDRERTEVPAELSALYDAEKARPDPAAGDKDAVYTALAASCGFAAVAAGATALGTGAAAGSGGTALGASTGATVASTGATVATTAGISSSVPALLLKPLTLLVFAAGAATGTGTTLLVEHVATPEVAPTRAVTRKAPTAARVAPPPPSVVPSPAPSAPPVAALQPVPSGEDANAVSEPPRLASKRTAPRKSRTPARARKGPSANTSVVERNLLERARTALSRGESAAALRALQQHHQKYPRGTLAEERGALMVVALAGLGKRTRARAAARRFKKRYPHSLLLPLVENALKRAADPR